MSARVNPVILSAGFLLAAMLITTRTQADECLSYNVPKQSLCNKNTVSICKQDFVYWNDGTPRACVPLYRIVKVHTGDFDCQSIPPPLPQAYAKCVDAWTGNWPAIVPVEDPCEDRNDCILSFGNFETGANPSCAPTVILYTVTAQKKIAISCFPTVDPIPIDP